MRKPQSPCNDCTSRSSECHAECEFYSQYEKQRVAYKELLLSQKQPEGVKYSKTRFGRIRKS